MHCRVCNEPLTPRMRFCPKCGTPVTPPPPGTRPADGPASLANNQPLPPTNPAQPWANTVPVESSGYSNSQPADIPVWQQPTTVPPQAQLSSPSPAAPLLPYNHDNRAITNSTNKGGTMPTTTATTHSAARPARRNRAGCLISILIVLVLLVLLVGAGFVLFVRPYAQAQIDQAMGNAVKQIPLEVAVLPAGPMQIEERTINNLIVLNHSPSDPIQNGKATISPANIRLDFQIFGQPCTITGVPTLVNGQLKAKNVTISGIVGLLVSPDELTIIIDKHLSEAQQRLKHSIQGVQLKDKELDLVLGPPFTA